MIVYIILGWLCVENQSTVKKAGVFSEDGNGYLDKEYVISKANVKHQSE